LIYRQLVVNGCSYMELYASGGGHTELAQGLGIESSCSLAIGGSANSRILRTTLKHSYLTDKPTLYILGMTFISRAEIPILKYKLDETVHSSFEGRWVNPQNQQFSNRWEHFWKEQDSLNWVELQYKADVYSLLDRTEDLMYRMLAAVSDLTSRGHQVLLFQQADDSYMLPDHGLARLIDSSRLTLFKSVANIVHGFQWQSVPWQHEQGVTAQQSHSPKSLAIMRLNTPTTEDRIKHRVAGHHQKLNEYLINYIKEHKIA